MNWRFGGEYWLMSWAAMRFGWWEAPGIQEADFGGAIKYKSLGFDISQGVPRVGTTTRFSVTMRMGQSNKSIHDRDVRELVRQALQYFKAGYFRRPLRSCGPPWIPTPEHGNKTHGHKAYVSRRYVPDATSGEEVPPSPAAASSLMWTARICATRSYHTPRFQQRPEKRTGCSRAYMVGKRGPAPRDYPQAEGPEISPI